MEDYLHYVGGAVGAAALTGAAAVALYMACSPTPLSVPIDLTSQSVEIPNSGGARASRFSPGGALTEFAYDDAKTLLEVMERGRRVSGDGPCLGRRNDDSDYVWLSYSETIEKAKNIASGLVNLGMKPGQQTFVGIYSQNCVEWILTEHACYNQSAVIVPLYDTLGPHACSFIINQAEIDTVVCDKEEKVKSLLAEAIHTPGLKQIIVIKPFSEEVKEQAAAANIKLRSFEEVEIIGRNNPHPVMAPQPSDLATVCYTSGTTGNPKGVMLTHRNIVIDASAVLRQLGEFAPGRSDIMLSFLPLAHMLERLCEVILYINGGRVGFYRGDIRMLMDDFKALKPTVIITVPRVLNRIYDKVQARVNGSKLKKLLLNLALRRKQSEIERSIIRSDSIWDKLVFKTVRDGLGGNLKLVVCGSAPLAENVLRFMRCAMGCLVVEGYGQTECVAPCTVNIQGDSTVGHVGPPISCCHIKLIDVPEMDYFSSNGQGEICIRGHNVTKGYFKDPERTAETIDEDGWLHTGDIGMWLPNGALRIVDRKKHIFKLAQGEYIAPEKIENIYLTSQFVAQIFVHGESLQSCLVGIIVPDKEMLLGWCKDNNVDANTWEEVCRDKNVKNAILEDITALGRKAGLKSFEQVKDIFLYTNSFTIDNGLLTPTLKTKRPDCRKYFMPHIEAMYQLLA